MDIFLRVLNPILMILFGLGVGIIVARQRNVEWRVYGIGALTFVGSQVLHIPFNLWVLNPVLLKVASSPFEDALLFISAMALGLSAGVFEETARYLVYRLWLKDTRTWKDALMFGAGHGGIEAILLGVFTLFTVINLIALVGKDLTAIVPENQIQLAQQQIEAFWALPWYGVLLGASERIFAICFHLAASVLVLQVFRRKNILWLFGSIGLHTLLNALAVYGVQTWGPYITELILAVFALLCLGIVFKLKTEEPNEPSVVVDRKAEMQAPAQTLSLDIIEDSKYAE
ncbi:MAG: YhfC family intramembrane metalloprotease [Anaerolineales bacterium]